MVGRSGMKPGLVNYTYSEATRLIAPNMSW